MKMLPEWGHIVWLMTVVVAIECLAVRRHGESDSASRKSNSEAEADTDYDSSEEWAPFRTNSPWNDSALLPTSVYNFQTGEFFNWDLNGSAVNQFLKAKQFSKNPVPLEEVELNSREERPRRYSSKYVKPEDTTIEENYETSKETKSDESVEEAPKTYIEGMQRDENEHYEVYEQHRKPAVVDNEKAESGHENKTPTNKKHSEGSGEEHHEDHHNKKKTKGLKDYKGEHHYHKGEKGHHDKEGHKGQYSDKKGSTKAHKEGGGHFESGVHGEKGQKEAKHSDKEEYKKGHSTRGGHVVHKKDEYEKKHEFYDEHHEGGDSEKHGEYHEEHHAKSGGHKKGGHKKGGGSGEQKAKKGHFEKGNKFHEQKGHKKAGGHEKKHEYDEKYGKKQGHSDWKKFGYESGKGKEGDSGGASSRVGHLLVPPPISSFGQTFIQDTDTKETKPVQSKEKFISKEEAKFPISLSVSDEEKPVYDESAPIPATDLKPPPFFKSPKVTISRFKFPPAENP